MEPPPVIDYAVYNTPTDMGVAEAEADFEIIELGDLSLEQEETKDGGCDAQGNTQGLGWYVICLGLLITTRRRKALLG